MLFTIMIVLFLLFIIKEIRINTNKVPNTQKEQDAYIIANYQKQLATNSLQPDVVLTKMLRQRALRGDWGRTMQLLQPYYEEWKQNH